MTMLLWFILSAGAVIFSILVLLGMVLWFIESESDEILDRLNGHIVHLYGNHSKVLRNQFKVNGFDYLEVTLDKQYIVMNHYAQRVWNRSHYGAIHCFGHSHGSLEGLGRSCDVGWDAQGRLRLLKDVVEELKQKEIHKEDNH